MPKEQLKHHKLKTIILTTTLTFLITNCSTTKHRDLHLINSLKLQNKTLKAALQSSSSKELPQSKIQAAVSKKRNDQIQRALTSVIESNNEIIKKLKPKQTKECTCGKNERTHD